MNFSPSIARASLIAAMLTGACAAAAPAFATDGDAIPQAALSVAGVDFASPQAVTRVKHQLSRVAANMCWNPADRRLFMTADERACYTTAVRDGLTQIDGRAQQAMRDRAVMVADGYSAR